MTTPTQMPESLKVPEELAAIQQALDAGPTPGPWMEKGRMDASGECIRVESHHAGRDHHLYQVADVLDANGYRINKANLAFILACNPAAMTAVLSHISALQSALKDRDAEIERLKKDAERLDWLDSLNQRLNAHHQTTYQWKLVLSPNVVRLMSGRFDIDLHDSDAKGVASCRAAIDSMKGDSHG